MVTASEHKGVYTIISNRVSCLLPSGLFLAVHGNLLQVHALLHGMFESLFACCYIALGVSSQYKFGELCQNLVWEGEEICSSLLADPESFIIENREFMSNLSSCEGTSLGFILEGLYQHFYPEEREFQQFAYSYQKTSIEMENFLKLYPRLCEMVNFSPLDASPIQA